jgi:hypothetical protein
MSLLQQVLKCYELIEANIPFFMVVMFITIKMFQILLEMLEWEVDNQTHIEIVK